jgi:hypothetical protein
MKLELFNKRSKKYSNTWTLNSMLLNDQWVIEEIRKDIKKFLKFNENGNTTHQNLWDRAKAVLRGNIALNAYIKNTERSRINNLLLCLKLLGKKEQAKLKTSRRREIFKN